MNKVVLSVLSLLLAASLHAQTTDNIVYLKNGSVIKGDVIESVPDRHIKVRTADGSIRTFFPSAGSRVTPTLLFQGGYTFNPDYDGMGRIVLMPGIQVPVNAKVDFNCGLDYIGAFGNGASASATA